ncbi:MAG: IgGFc-binding protein, partial [Saprospiraceae bacterium]|nr:IgGFc-binding protein [Saprospiraceae bacterium]
MKRILIVLLTIIIFMPVGYSQLSLNHYLPPLVTGEFNSDDGARPGENEICISTPSLTSVNVTITFPGNASLDATPTISNSSPVCITLPNGFASPLLTRASESTADLDVLGNPIANLGAVISASEPVYVKYRVRSANSNQADIYTSKGTAATGTEFRTAHLLSPSTYPDRLSFVSVMALNNDTDVTINDGGMPAGVDVLGHPVNQTSITTNLNQYETKIFAVRPDNGVNSVAFIGSLVSSNKDIVVVVGSMNGNMAQPDPNVGGARDYGLDQIVPTSLVGTDYFLFKGNGTAADTLYERPIIVATSDNTDVFINGSATPFATLNTGDYTTVSDYNSDGLMYVSSSNPVYVYQPILGSNSSVATNGMFFVPPISCSAPNSVDNIPDVNGLGTATGFTGCLNILTRDLAMVTVNGVDIDLNTNVGSATVFGPYTIPYLINGNAYKGFRVDGLSGDVSVNSDYDLYCGLFGYSGFAGYGGYFSGFNTPP